jgi:hypothetical protein
VDVRGLPDLAAAVPGGVGVRAAALRTGDGRGLSAVIRLGELDHRVSPEDGDRGRLGPVVEYVTELVGQLVRGGCGRSRRDASRPPRGPSVSTRGTCRSRCTPRNLLERHGLLDDAGRLARGSMPASTIRGEAHIAAGTVITLLAQSPLVERAEGGVVWLINSRGPRSAADPAPAAHAPIVS